MLKNDQEITRTSQTYRRQNQSAWPACCAFLSCRAQLPSHAKKIYAVTIVGTILKPLQIGEIMSINNEILQFSYFYWKSNEKKSWRENDLISGWNLPLLRYCVMLLEKCIMGYYYSIVVWFEDFRAYLIRLFSFTYFPSVSLCEQIRGVISSPHVLTLV